MKNILLISLVFMIVLSSVAQKPRIKNGVFVKNYQMDQAVTLEPYEKISVPQVAPKHSSLKSGDNANIVTVLDLGTSANVLGYSSGTRTMVWADDDLNVVINVHRMGPGSTPPSLSGYLGVDIGTSLGLIQSNWTSQIQVHSATLAASPYYFDASRYPSAAIYNPSGNTNPANAYMAYFAPNFANLVVSGFGGYCFGTANLVNHADTNKNLRWYSPPPYTYIPDGFAVTHTGVAHMVDADCNVESGSIVYQDSVIYGRGVWNNTTKDFNYTFRTISFPTMGMHNLADNKIAASEDGQTVWMTALGNMVGATPLIDSTFFPIVRKSTDGGLTWSAPQAIQLDGPNGIAAIKNHYSDYFISTLFTPPLPTRDAIPYTTAFDHSISVDKWGNLHIGVAVGYSPGGYSISSGVDSLINVYDIYTINGGYSWQGVFLGTLKTFRGTWATYVSDNRVYTSRNKAGDKMFFTWNDTHIDGETNNQNPDVFARGFDLITNKLTTPDIGADASNVTFLCDITQEAYFQCASPIVFTDNNKFTIPIVTQWFSDGAGSTQFKYIPDFSYVEADFTIPINSTPIPNSLTISGTLLDGNAAPIQGANLVFTNLTPGTYSTNGAGYYSVVVPAGYTGTVTPSKAGYSFTPLSRSYSNVQASQSGQNYTGIIQNHFVPVWTGNPLYPMSIAITQAILDGANLIAGDEIGVFDGTICVGAYKLTAPINPVSPPFITVSKDDPATTPVDGYTEGHSIIYKLWKSSVSLEVSNVAHSFPYTPSFAFENFTQSETAVVALSGISTVTQNTPLLAGWNMISFNAQPANMNLLNILQPLVSSGNLVKVIDEAGLIIQNFPWGWVNNIGNMAVTEGYYIKVAAACTLNVSGAPILAPTAIPLITGWNIMGYPGQTAQNALTALQPLINAGILLKVIDEAGNIIQYFPWGWVNNIGNFKPGEGYYIKVLSACSVTISNLKDALEEPVPAARSVHFTLPVQGNPYQPMSLGLSFNPEFCKSIAPGSEIGVFEGNLCVGAFRFDGTRVSNVVITVYADDPESPELEGFTEGGSISFKFWEQGSLKEVNQEVIHQSGDKVFSRLGTFVGELNDLPSAKSANDQSLAWLGNNYPNPFSGMTEVEFKVFEPCTVVLTVLSPQGILVREVVNSYYQPGSYKSKIDAKLLSRGVWFYRLEARCDGRRFDQTLKMVVN